MLPAPCKPSVSAHAAAFLASVSLWLLPASPAAADRWADQIERADAACADQDFALAEDLLRWALDEMAAADADGHRARDTHHRLGLVHAATGDAVGAEAELLWALGEGSTLSPPTGEASAHIATLSSLAVLYENLGELGNAEARREQIVSLAQAESMTPQAIAIAKANLARYRNRHGAEREAIDGHTEALLLLEQNAGRPALSAEQLEALAAIHKEAGRWVEAEAAYTAAHQIWSGLGDPPTFVRAKTLAGYADLLWKLDRRVDAIELLESAFDVAEVLYGVDSLHVSDFIHAHALFLRTLGAQVTARK